MVVGNQLCSHLFWGRCAQSSSPSTSAMLVRVRPTFSDHPFLSIYSRLWPGEEKREKWGPSFALQKHMSCVWHRLRCEGNVISLPLFFPRLSEEQPMKDDKEISHRDHLFLSFFKKTYCTAAAVDYIYMTDVELLAYGCEVTL